MDDEKGLALLFLKRSATSINSGNYTMSRGYPRFLFSDPQNIKTPGPFVVHLLEPRLVFKVFKNEDLPGVLPESYQGPWHMDKGIGLMLLDNDDSLDDRKYDVLEDALKWVITQKKAKTIQF